MCGIFGYIGKRNSTQIVIDGLKQLEYRGYDSAGLAGIKNGEIYFCKEVGKVASLEKKVKEAHLEFDLAIAHTRWATHGKPSLLNAHPHMNASRSLAVVHNGIIENYEPLRRMLQEENISFVSETDTEVIVNLISHFYQGNFLKAVQQTVALLKGSYAFAAIHKDFPHQIIACAQEAPLIIGLGSQEIFLSSDSHALSPYTREVIFLSKGEIGVLKADHLEVYDSAMTQVNKKTEQIAAYASSSGKGDFEHYTLKEISEQPQTIQNALLSRFIDEYGTAVFEELDFTMSELLEVQRILILACGTSWHAGYVASYLLEDKARIPVQVEISSEYRYKNPVVLPGTLVIAISQSGETADTLAAVRELKTKGSKILAICNVYDSSLTREADTTIFLRAGPEIGVCSTKAFTSQMVVLALFSLLMARMRNMGKTEGQEFLHALKKLPDQVQQVLDQSKHIEQLAKKYARYENFFYIGRSYMYPTSLEGALKLKEISYVNANGYPAGELKHGPIALINENCPTIALCANKLTYEKLKSNLMEVKARNGPLLAIAADNALDIDSIADDVIRVPDTDDWFASISTTVAMQLFAYFIAKERGADIDQPRNLAKSVTVE
jgi:glutamine---fructose-6-phosphate transaminase (isomerizing)